MNPVIAGSTPRSATNHVPFGYWLGRHPLKVEKAGSKPPGDTNARVAERQTHLPQKQAPQGVEVQVLSRAPTREGWQSPAYCTGPENRHTAR